MKEYTIIINRRNRTIEVTGTLEYLKSYFSYTLKVGKSYENEKGCRKINMNPKGVKALVTNFNKAVDNASLNGYSDTYYEYAE